ncbi:MAG: 16S rRNA (cytosine(1402)-N(4))-methyltransferase RsmH, partial [Verrucomicrobiota bacterium]
RFLDATLGGGGHTRALLKEGTQVLGLDQDRDALEEAERWGSHEENLALVQTNFRHLGELLQEIGCGPFDGMLFDLGVSSHQLDEAERGFSFQQEGPLDMRMNQGGNLTAYDVVNHYEEDGLVTILRDYGEEPHAVRLAKAIVRRRQRGAIETTLELAGLVEEVVPKRGKRHPATRAFQAIRMEVNDELGSVKAGLENAIRWIRPGGRLAVITFHSLEDRLVKRFLRSRSEKWIDRPEWPAPRPNPDYCLDLKPRRGIVAQAEEVKRNPRARSARLRVAEIESSGLLA